MASITSQRSSKRLKQSADHGDEEDRISNLHESILQHILSFVDMETVVYSTRYLSKRWRNLWTSLPSLHFSNRYKNYMTFVDRVLFLRDNKSSNIDRFHVNSNYICRADRVSSWIIFAALHNVQELMLNLHTNAPIKLPGCLFTRQTVRVVKLISHLKGRPISLQLPCPFRLIRLQVLHFERVVFDAHLIVQVLANCPELETLIIRQCDQISNLNKLCISSECLKNLDLELGQKSVKDKNLQPVKICTPNLSSLRLSHCVKKYYYYHPVNLNSLVTADIAVQVANKLELVHLLFSVMTVLIGLWNVEHLTLQSCLVEVLSKNLNRMKGRMLLWNLRWLKLNVLSYASCLRALPVLLLSALFLETLVVENKIEPRESAYCSTNMIADTELGLQLDHTEYLRTVEMKNFKASDDELKFLKILLNTASALEKIIFTGAEQEYTNWMFNISEWVKNEVESFSRTSQSILVLFCHPTMPSKIKSYTI